MQRYQSLKQWTTLSLLFLALCLPGISSSAQAQPKESLPQETVQITQLHDADDPSVTTLGAARLIRSRDELWATFHVSDLAPGSAYTIWAVVFNEPSACTTSPEAEARCGLADIMATPNQAQASAFHVGAFLTDGDGTANSSIHLLSGPPPAGTSVLFGEGGLNDNGVRPELRAGNGFEAEVHLVIRGHGAILAEALADQLSRFNGGCPEEPPNAPCANEQAAVFPPVTE